MRCRLLADPTDSRILKRSNPLRLVTLGARLALGAAFVARYTKANRIDVLYCNNLVPEIVGTLGGLLSRTPVVWHERNIHRTSLRRFALGCLSQLPAVRRIICVSNATAAQYASWKRAKTCVIHNGIPLAEFDPKMTVPALRREYGIPHDKGIVGACGRFDDWKGYDILLEAAAVVLRNRDNVVFVLLGDANTNREREYKQACEAIARERGINTNVLFAGYKGDVRGYLRDFDVVVVPSVRPDPFPRVVLEGMAMGKPVIGTRVGGIPEVIRDGVNGFLVTPGDSHELADRIECLLSDRSRRERMGGAARECIERNYDVSILTHLVEDVIRAAAGD